MASADDYARWIVANPGKRGTPEFDTVVAAYRDAKRAGSQPVEPISVDPSEGGSTLKIGPIDTGLKLGQAATRTLAGIGSGMSDLAYGAGQRLGLVDQATIDQKKKLDEPLLNTTAGRVGSVGGKVVTGLPAAFIPGANTLVGAGVVGAGQGFLEPTASDESVIKNMLVGGAGGVGGVVLGRVLRAGYNGVRGLIEPFTSAGQEKIAGRVLERFAEDPGALRNASAAPTVTGAIPTLAEATKDRGIAALQRSLESQDPQVAAKFAQRAADNNAARVGVLQNIAGDDAARTAALTARKDASDAAYKAATSATYTVDPTLKDLLSRPAVKQAMERAKTMAANQGRDFAFEVNVTNPAANPKAWAGATQASSKQITGQGLQDIKMAMDEMLTDPASGFSGKAGDTIKNLRGQIVNWMEQANPAFGEARKAYAAASKPINQMDVGQRLLDKTTSAIRDLSGNQKLQANAFARALNDEQSLVRNATGFKGVNALADVMTPDQLNKLGAIRNELELASNLAAAANGSGSQTAKSLASQNLLRQIVGPAGLPQSWAESALLETALRPVQFGMKAAEPRIQNKLADVLLDPSKASSALNAAQVKELNKSLARLLPYLQQAGQQSIPAALMSGQR